MSVPTSSPVKPRRSPALKIAVPLVVLLAALVVGHFAGAQSIIGTWSGDTVDRLGRRMHMTMAFDDRGRETLMVDFYPDTLAGDPVPGPAIYTGTYFFENHLLVQDLVSKTSIPESTFYDRPLHGARQASRELRCIWKVHDGTLFLSAMTSTNVILKRIK